MTRAILALVGVGFALWFYWLRPGDLGGHTSYIFVSGKSMEPVLRGGDLVIALKQTQYRPGDVIAFESERGTIIHRIVSGNGQHGFLTLGDNNLESDPWLTTDDRIIGKQYIRVPGYNSVLRTFTSPPGIDTVLVSLSGIALVLLGLIVRERFEWDSPLGGPVRSNLWSDFERRSVLLPARIMEVQRLQRHVAVASSMDLVRLAERRRLAILRSEERGSYLVRDGAVTYEFNPDPPRRTGTEH